MFLIQDRESTVRTLPGTPVIPLVENFKAVICLCTQLTREPLVFLAIPYVCASTLPLPSYNQVFYTVFQKCIRKLFDWTGYVMILAVISVYFRCMWWYHIIGGIWTVEFILACQQMIVAGSITIWYFSR